MGEAHLPNRGKAKAQFTAALLLEKQVKLSFSQLEAELKRIAPRAVLGDWGGPVTNPAVDPGMGMLNLNGENLSVLVIDARAPAAVLKPGPFANSLWPNAETDAAHHTAHIVIIGLQDTIDREAALAKARAVTLLAAAIVRLVPAIGVTWVDGANLVRASAFPVMTKNIGQPDANAVPFWVRIMLAKGRPGARGEQTMKAGTLGLRIFGLRELEYAPVPLDPGFILQHAYSVSEYLLRSGKRRPMAKRSASEARRLSRMNSPSRMRRQAILSRIPSPASASKPTSEESLPWSINSTADRSVPASEHHQEFRSRHLNHCDEYSPISECALRKAAMSGWGQERL